LCLIIPAIQEFSEYPVQPIYLQGGGKKDMSSEVDYV